MPNEQLSILQPYLASTATQGEDRTMKIKRLSGVIIWTDQFTSMVTFYEKELGLSPHSVKPDFVAFKWGTTKFSIGQHSEVSGQSKDPYRIMLNFDVSDIVLLCKELTDRGVNFIRKPEREHWGGLVATINDPDGNIVQLLQHPIIKTS